jgi:hypothetical protein
MVRVDSRLLMGATLFATPGLKGGINLPALGIVVFVVLVVVMRLVFGRHPRSGPSDPDGGDGWGNGPPPPNPRRPDRPDGGVPLSDATPARVRLRGAGRLTDLLPSRVRRPAREPDRAPVRTPGIR